MKGMYIAASGMTYRIEALNEVAANIANVNTSGYKRSQVVGKSSTTWSPSLPIRPH